MSYPETREETAAQVLDAWGAAIRGDWGNIDGRQSRSELAAVSAYLRGERETLTTDDVGVCMMDLPPHWMGLGYGHDCGRF